jgi:uncharacterized protein (DUF2336 family)
MLGFIKKLGSKNKSALKKSSPKKSSLPQKQARDPARYEQEKKIAQSAGKKERLNLAGNSKTHQDILFYLAENDPDAVVRKAVAGNPSTPVQASTALSKDSSEDVRMTIAGRLVDLLPDLSVDKQSQLYAYAVQALGDLALDEVLKIRKALSSALKDHAHTPPKIAGELARDVEREVAEPILRFCAALSDDDMLDILAGHPAEWAVQAVAKRDTVSAFISEAVIKTEDRPAGKALIENEGADITPKLLVTIVEKSKQYPEWQAPISVRKLLPPEMAKELASFTDDTVRAVLLKRKDFDKALIKEIGETVKRRVTFASEGETEHIESDPKAVMERAKKMKAQGKLTEETIADALGMRDEEFVYAAFALMTNADIETIRKIFSMKAAKALVALCWHAGLSMRMALEIQKQMGGIPHKELIIPKGGTDYPMSQEDMIWQLEFLGLR